MQQRALVAYLVVSLLLYFSWVQIREIWGSSAVEINKSSESGQPSTMLATLPKTSFNRTLYSSIRKTWFDPLPWGSEVPIPEIMQRWWTASPPEKQAFDAQCRRDFGHAIESISPKDYAPSGMSDVKTVAPFLKAIEDASQSTNDDGVEKSDASLSKTQTALSLCILLDQIPRNIYRTQNSLKLVYSHYDRIAVALSRHIISTEPRLDKHPSILLSMPFRQWFYMPLMHSEDVEDHRAFEKVLEEMKRDIEAQGGTLINWERTSDFEASHVKIVERFGRYPHRNQCLGRESTVEEREYLSGGGETFGVASG